MKSKILLYLILISGLQCKKMEDERSKLPLITQEGKRTFGCLINGKAWTAENGGLIITRSPLRFVYEYTNGGLFYIIAKKSITAQNIDEEIIIAVDSCTTAKKYFFTNSHSVRFAYIDYNNAECRDLFSKDTGVLSSGAVSVTRLDLSEGIIAGTFEFTLSKNGCEVIDVTEGRFDAKL
jgi:hypothetical protein